MTHYTYDYFLFSECSCQDIGSRNDLRFDCILVAMSSLIMGGTILCLRVDLVRRLWLGLTRSLSFLFITYDIMSIGIFSPGASLHVNSWSLWPGGIDVAVYLWRHLELLVFTVSGVLLTIPATVVDVDCATSFLLRQKEETIWEGQMWIYRYEKQAGGPIQDMEKERRASLLLLLLLGQIWLFYSITAQIKQQILSVENNTLWMMYKQYDNLIAFTVVVSYFCILHFIAVAVLNPFRTFIVSYTYWPSLSLGSYEALGLSSPTMC